MLLWKTIGSLFKIKIRQINYISPYKSEVATILSDVMILIMNKYLQFESIPSWKEKIFLLHIFWPILPWVQSCVSYIQFFLLNCLGDMTQSNNEDLLWWRPYWCNHLYSSCLSNHSLHSHSSSICAQTLEEPSTAVSIACTLFISHGSLLSSTMSHKSFHILGWVVSLMNSG